MCRAARYARRLGGAPSPRGGRLHDRPSGATVIRLPIGDEVSRRLRAAAAAAGRQPSAARQRLSLTVMTLIAVLAAGSAAFAGDDNSAFSGVDRNGDGVIDIAEIRLTAAEAFVESDYNRDSVLTSDEIGDDLILDFRAADRDRDAGLTFEEFMNAHADDYSNLTGSPARGLTLQAVKGW